MIRRIVYSMSVLLLFSCKTQHKIKPNSLIKLKFIGEQIVSKDTEFNQTKVGGLSSIEYVDGKFYSISDDKDKPVRFYEFDLDYNEKTFSKVTITNMVEIKIDEKGLDPESLRFSKKSNSFFWSSEGFIRKGIDPKVFEITKDGVLIKEHITPKIFKAKYVTKTNGIRRNGTFEGLSMSLNPDYYWIGMELPLKQDGAEPQLIKGEYPIRISKIDKKTDSLVYQFAYMLDRIQKNSIPKNKFIVNGCPEILEIDEKHFLFLERAYASGYKDGGNTVKIFYVDCTDATNILAKKSLLKEKYIPATKKLIFDFEFIRDRLTRGIVDNIEGITFGKTLENGNKTLVVISDNNFNKFNPQLNQIIVFEIIE